MPVPQDQPTTPLILMQTSRPLIPGGYASLRMDMDTGRRLLHEVARENVGVGLCMDRLMGASETSPDLAEVGTEGVIEDFRTNPDGTMQVRFGGARRFQRVRDKQEPGQLQQLEVIWRPSVRVTYLPFVEEMAHVLKLLYKALGYFGEVAPHRLEDAEWMSWQFAAALAKKPLAQQAMLQEDNPHARFGRFLEMYTLDDERPN